MAKLSKKTFGETFTQPRGWGYEKWIENIPEYCGKLLHVEAGKKGSLHFHMNKTETMFLQSGRFDLIFVDPDEGKEYTIQMNPGDSILIPRGQVHQIVALEDSDIFEFSTVHEESDSRRVRKGS